MTKVSDLFHNSKRRHGTILANYSWVRRSPVSADHARSNLVTSFSQQACPQFPLLQMPQLPHRLQPSCRHFRTRTFLFTSSSDGPSTTVNAQPPLSDRPVMQQPYPGNSQMHILLSNVSGGQCKTHVIGNGSSLLMVPSCKHSSRRSCSKVQSRSFKQCTYSKGRVPTTILKYPSGHAI